MKKHRKPSPRKVEGSPDKGGEWLHFVSSPGMGFVYAFRHEDNAREFCNGKLSYYELRKVWIPKSQINKWLKIAPVVVNNMGV